VDGGENDSEISTAEHIILNIGVEDDGKRQALDGYTGRRSSKMSIPYDGLSTFSLRAILQHCALNVAGSSRADLEEHQLTC